MTCVLYFSFIQTIIFSCILLELLETVFENKIIFKYTKKMLQRCQKQFFIIIHNLCNYLQNYKLFDVDIDLHIKIKS